MFSKAILLGTLLAAAVFVAAGPPAGSIELECDGDKVMKTTTDANGKSTSELLEDCSKSGKKLVLKSHILFLLELGG